MSKPKQESNSLFKTIVALLLIAGCLWASQWQYHRGQLRHHRNAVITSHVNLPAVSLEKAILDPEKAEWRPVVVTGRFKPETQILLRNHYFEGKYGFELLTLFTSTRGQEFWVDRGWVQAGASATIQPTLPTTPTGDVTITGRFRLNTSLPQGNIFAVPTRKDSPLIAAVNAQNRIENQLFYIDLISGSQEVLTPDVSAEIPELSDGPHMAYALQWLLFAVLICYGRILIRRLDLDESKAQSKGH